MLYRYETPRQTASSRVFFDLLAIFILLATGWWWLLIIRPMLRARRTGRPIPLASSLALQASMGAVPIAALLGEGFWDLVWNLALPPAMPLLWLLNPPTPLRAVLAQNRTGIFVGLLGAVALVVAMAAISRRLVRLSLIPALAVAMILFLALVERRSAARMEARAAELRADCLARHSFRESLGFWGEELQWDLHASARINADWYGWSYREDDFYRIPEGAPKDGNGLQAACLDQIKAAPPISSATPIQNGA